MKYENLSLKLKNLPDAPGVYLFRIWKAKSFTSAKRKACATGCGLIFNRD